MHDMLMIGLIGGDHSQPFAPHDYLFQMKSIDQRFFVTTTLLQILD